VLAKHGKTVRMLLLRSIGTRCNFALKKQLAEFACWGSAHRHRDVLALVVAAPVGLLTSLDPFNRSKDFLDDTEHIYIYIYVCMQLL
jgi:hypothetical protein